jgi:hypothetical protein
LPPAMKVTPKNLFKTFIFSTLLGIAATSIYYSISQKDNGYDYGHVVPFIIEGSIFLNLISIIMSLPGLFLNQSNLWANSWLRLVLYFSGPVLLIFTVIFGQINSSDKTIYLLILTIFLITHAIFYRKMIKNNG